jgi:hypothetical protein
MEDKMEKAIGDFAILLIVGAAIEHLNSYGSWVDANESIDGGEFQCLH